MTPMKASSASERTDERTTPQEENFRRLLRDIAEHAATVALGKVKANKKGWQRAIESGDKLREAVTDAVIQVVEQVSDSRLRRINVIPVPATEDVVLTEQTLKERFNIGWLGENAKRLFLSKTIKGAPAGKVAVNQLRKLSTNQQLKDELGGTAVLSFARMLSLVEQQKNSREGHLLTNGWANLIIVEVEGELWVVDADWDSDCGCWYVEANPIGYPCKWRVEGQVLSCDS